MQHVQITLDSLNKIAASPSMQQLPGRYAEYAARTEPQYAGLPARSAAYNKMVADMQRLDQVLRELQPVLKTLNDKSNALVFEPRIRKILSRREQNNEKWRLAAACALAACSSGK